MEAAESSISHRRQVWTKDYLFLQSPQPINQTTSHNKSAPATSHNQPNIASLRCILSIDRIDGSCFFKIASMVRVGAWENRGSGRDSWQWEPGVTICACAAYSRSNTFFNVI